MAAIIGALRADLSASVAKFESDMGRAAKAVEAFGKSADRISQSLEAAGQRMTLALTAPFIALAASSAKAAAESNDAMNQVESRLASMGNASGRTADQLEASAKSLQRLSTFDDDDILRDVTVTMLTFGKVSGEVFDRAQRATVDFATTMKKDLGSSAVMVGKALNDPVKGLTQLGRAGVQFTNSQKEAVKAFVKTGQTAKAQIIILEEFERQFLGAGVAAREAVPGADAIDAWRDFQETVGEIVLRLVDAVEPFIVKLLDGFTALEPGLQTAILAFGAIAAAIGPLLWAFGAFAGAVANLAPLWAGFVKIFADAMLAANITSVATAVRALTAFLGPIAAAIGFVIVALIEFRGIFVEAFQSIMGVIQGDVLPAFQRLGASLSALFSELQSGPIGGFVRFVMWAVAEIVGLFLKVMGGSIGKALAMVGDTIANFVGLITGFVKIINRLLAGDFAGAWEAAGETVSNFVQGMLNVWEHLIPGIGDALSRLHGMMVEWLQGRINALLGWIENRFPGLVDAVRAAAEGAIGWAKNLYQGIRGWISDKLGPLIKWAKDRIRELNGLFSWITRRQNKLSGNDTPPEGRDPAPPTAPPAPPPPADDGGGGGGGGGSRSNRTADNLKRATDRLREALDDVQDNIDKAFDRRSLPRSMQQAEDLRRRLTELQDEARAAGVDMGAFAQSIATLQTRIRELELEGLAKEAEEFRRDVRDLAAEITDFGGGLTPLEEQLAGIDERYESLRQEIVDSIEANRALAGANAEAAAAMAVLEGQLARLDEAHKKATDSARAQAAAEKEIADLHAQRDATDTAIELRDAQQASGRRGVMSPAQREMQKIQDDLMRQRQDALIKLRELEAEQEALRAAGDVEAADRLQEQINLQRELYDVVSNTTAEQIRAQDYLQGAWEEAVDGISGALGQMVTDFEGGVESLKRTFLKIISDFVANFAKEKGGQILTNVLSRFAGGFAEGGTLRPGQWGIAGEVGPEPIFAGSRPLHVLSNEEAMGGGKGGGFYIDARGAGPREVDELRRMFENMNANFDRRVIDASNTGIQRGQIRPPNF